MSLLPQDENGNVIQAGNLARAVNQQVTIAGASASTTNAMKENLVMLVATTLCFVAVGDTAALTDTPLVANVPYFFTVQVGKKLSVIDDGTGGTLYVTEL